MKAAAKVVADLCLYGNRGIGFGYLLAAGNKILSGDGEPKADRDLTTCLFMAAADLSERGIHEGIVQVVAPGGESMAEVDLGWGMPYYGMLVTHADIWGGPEDEHTQTEGAAREVCEICDAEIDPNEGSAARWLPAIICIGCAAEHEVEMALEEETVTTEVR